MIPERTKTHFDATVIDKCTPHTISVYTCRVNLFVEFSSHVATE